MFMKLPKYNLSLHKTIETYGLCIIMRSFFHTSAFEVILSDATIICLISLFYLKSEGN